jgi:hypothetical protein
MQAYQRAAGSAGQGHTILHRWVGISTNIQRVGLELDGRGGYFHCSAFRVPARVWGSAMGLVRLGVW